MVETHPERCIWVFSNSQWFHRKLQWKIAYSNASIICWTFFNFRKYFSTPDPCNNWIRDPFNMEITNAKHLSAPEHDILAELSCDTTYKLKFNKTELSNFWLLLRSDYPALQHLIPFCTTYLCEQAFSVLFYIKSKYRNKRAGS